MLTSEELELLQQKEDLSGQLGGKIIDARLKEIETQTEKEECSNEWDEYSKWTGDHHVWPRHTGPRDK